MEFWRTFRRLCHIWRMLLRHRLTHLWAVRPGRSPRAGIISGPERLRRVLEDLGGTFIKFGQMLALQPDILSLEYCNALFNLLDRVAPFGFDQVERIFLEEFGRRPAEIFD